MQSHSSYLFGIGQSLLVDFGLYAPKTSCLFWHVLSFWLSHCLWTLACAVRLVLSFLLWSVTVGGLWLARFHSSCLFFTGQPLLVDIDLCSPTRLVFLTLITYYWWTLTCALPLVLSFWHWSITVGGLWLVRFQGLWLGRSHSSCLFDIGQPLLVDIDLCAPIRLVFFDIGQPLFCGLWLARFHSSCLFDIGQPLMVDINFCAPTHRVFFHWSVIVGGLWHVRSPSFCLFDIGQSLLVNLDLCAHTRLVFLTLVSHCWWTLTCAFPLVLYFWYWSVTVGGLWLERSHSSCLFWHWTPIIGGLWLVRSHSSYLFCIGQSLFVDFGLYAPSRLVFFDMSCLFYSVTVGGLWLVRSQNILSFLTCLVFLIESLFVDFGLCCPSRLVFLTLVSHCWWTLTCALPLVLSWHWSATVGGLWLVPCHSSCLFEIGQSLLVDFYFCVTTRLVFLTSVSHCWWTLTCTLPLVLSFWYWSVTVNCRRYG